LYKEFKDNKNFFNETIIFPWSIKYAENDKSAFKGKGTFGKVLRAFDGNQ
jgi:hypothetical protein